MSSLGVDRLSHEDQLRLVGELLENLEVGDPPLTAAQRAELDRRLAALDSGATTVSPWSEVEARILQRLGA
jgi:putative addiction module component (TIGR02574 family)